MEIESKQQIFARRKEIEKQLLEMLEEVKSGFGLDEIKDIIYNEKDKNDLVKILKIFDRGQNIDELNKMLAIINDAWNYFPHKCLNGLCPMEKILEYRQKHKNP